MSENTDLTVIEIKPEQAPALYVPGGLAAFLEQIRQQVNEVPDLNTAKGRARVASLSAMVSRSKTAVEKPGRDYLRHLKEAVKPAEAELRWWVTECDKLRDEVRKPLTDWDAEQERIKSERQMLAWHEEALQMNADFDRALAERFESDHEIAILMNEKFDRELAEAKAEASRRRIAHEEELKRQAAENARIEAEQKAKAELEAAQRREAEERAAKERAERERIEAQQRAEREAKEAAERAEREKLEAIEAERRKAQEEADRIKREAEAKECARLAEEKRVADEAAAREADVKHRKAVGTAIVKGLMAHAGLSREQAISTLTAIINNQVPNTRITY